MRNLVHRPICLGPAAACRRSSSFWLPLLLLVTLTLSTAVQAQFSYTKENGAITITGCTGAGGDVTVPSTLQGLPVTIIGDNAFFGTGRLTSVTIPNSVTAIGSAAFAGCTRLTSVMVDAGNLSYASMDGLLFNRSLTLLIQYPPAKEGTTYAIPNRVTAIGNVAFADCFGLANVTIPSSVTAIGDGAFAGCSGLTSISFDATAPR